MIQNKIESLDIDALGLRLIQAKVLKVRHLTDEAFVVRTSKNGIDFMPGQRVRISMPGDSVKRKYSIYSGVNDPYLEFLVREVKGGYLSPKLKALQPGDRIEIVGPNGHFTIYDEIIPDFQFLFIATGTGIAPFHSFVKSYPNLDYQLLHGVRHSSEAYDVDDYCKNGIVLCTSKENSGHFNGRVTDYLKKNLPGKDTQIYLCGNNYMIVEVAEFLLNNGFIREQIFSEVYF